MWPFREAESPEDAIVRTQHNPLEPTALASRGGTAFTYYGKEMSYWPI